MIPVVARRLNGERLSILSWPRAILMQMAHPLIAAGVARHSTFRGGAASAARRAHGTISAMLSLTFGSDIEREATLAHIRGIHRRVRGTLGEDAGPFASDAIYSAEDPALLLWVHATLLDSIADFHVRAIGPLSRAELDAFCDESAPTLVALGGDRDRAPRDWASLRGYMDAIGDSGALTVTGEARAIAGTVLTPHLGTTRAPGGGLHRLLTIGLLPPRLRHAYGFEWNALRQRRFDLLLRVLRRARRLTPDVIARWE